jgi:hypothetical protein
MQHRIEDEQTEILAIDAGVADSWVQVRQHGDQPGALKYY